MESTAHKAGQDQSSKRARSSPSGSSASTCSYPSCPLPYLSSSSQSSRKENVEDVWKEMNLASLHEYPITTKGKGTSASITQTRSFLGSMFLDYLGKGIDASSDRTSSLFDKIGLNKGTFLRLNSASGCQYIGMTNTAGPLTSSCKRRVGENADEFHKKKFKRLMKNSQLPVQEQENRPTQMSWNLRLPVCSKKMPDSEDLKKWSSKAKPCPQSA